MPKRSELTITKRTVDGLAAESREAVYWDRELPGFGVRVYPSGAKIYVAQSRGPSGIKRVSLGRHGGITAEQARKRARAAIARIKQGEEPARTAPESNTSSVCCSACNSDPAVSSHFNSLPRRSARNPRAEQHPGNAALGK